MVKRKTKLAKSTVAGHAIEADTGQSRERLEAAAQDQKMWREPAQRIAGVSDMAEWTASTPFHFEVQQM